MSEDHDAEPYAARLYRALKALETYTPTTWPDKFRAGSVIIIRLCPMCNVESARDAAVSHTPDCILGDPANVALLRDGSPRGDTP